ncbi:MAG: aldehyde dehydrogenase (NADP(+)), partial [Chitinophagaceae bacterium]
VEVIRVLGGQLTATVIGLPKSCLQFQEEITLLQEKVGRIIFNGTPTGVDVGQAMQHGGPFPATTDPRFTSVGAEAIKRFLRPFCFQNWPNELLPEELQDENPLGIWRKIDGCWTDPKREK